MSTPVQPPIHQVGTGGANYTPGRGGHSPIAISHHEMQGTLAGTIAAFANPDHQASAHFGVGRDGAIVQFVDVADMAWANGPIRNPNLAAVPWLADCLATPQRQATNPNKLTISIEWEGMHLGGSWIWVPWDGEQLQTLAKKPAPTFWEPPPAQYAAGLGLTRWLAATYHIVLDRAHITRHSDFDSVTKWFCPGAGFPMTRLLTDLGGHL